MKLFFGALLATFCSCAAQDKKYIIVNCDKINSYDNSQNVYIITEGDFISDTAWKEFIPKVINDEIKTGKYKDNPYVIFWVLKKDEFTSSVNHCDLINADIIFKNRLNMYQYTPLDNKLIYANVDSLGNTIYTSPNP